jgi:uncharacterized NAD-dependent epimerase/dehydratase family protein
MRLKLPLLLFLGDVADQLAAKTAQGLVDWRRDWCVAQLRLPGCRADTGLPDMDLRAAVANGARMMVIGVVNPGGRIPDSWQATIVSALESGLDIAAGMHTPLNALPNLVSAAERNGRKLIDVRQPSQKFNVGTGAKRTGRRLLTVGTDCSVGKKYTALAIEKELRERGVEADFRATGQTGIFIAGDGVAIDAVVADFISGAAEWISPDSRPHHWDIIEGQGAILHPSFAGVSLGLLHGSQPDAVVVCHEPTRKTMRNVAHPIPSIGTVIEQTLALGRVVNPDIRAVGIAINTAALDANAAEICLREAEETHNLPACDPTRTGVGPIVKRLQAEFGV